MDVKTLLAINVDEHIEKKNNLSYLSWAWAWIEALKADPAASYVIGMFEEHGPNGQKKTVPYMSINGTAMVSVTATLFGKPMTCLLPVMDYKNKAIPNPDAFAVNTAIMRCLVKALALHGLGMKLYAGEDIPKKDEQSGKKGTGPIHSPRDGIGEDLEEDVKSHLTDLALHIRELVEAGEVEEAVKVLEDEKMDSEQKTYAWNQMPAHVRSKIKNFMEQK